MNTHTLFPEKLTTMLKTIQFNNANWEKNTSLCPFFQIVMCMCHDRTYYVVKFEKTKGVILFIIYLYAFIRNKTHSFCALKTVH